MRLIYHILLRFTLITTLVLTCWAVLFYFTLIDEVNDETDDSLEDYAEAIVTRALAGEELPSRSGGTNNQYYLHRVSAAYAASHPAVRYADDMVYIRQKGEHEPARILTYIFTDSRGQHHELSVSTPTIEKADLKHSMLLWMVILYGTLLFFLVGISVWMFHRNLRPLYVLLRWLDAEEADQKSKPLHNPTRIAEFRKLNDAATRYARRMEEAFELQRQFTANASHELQTPLAICTARLEMLMEDESLSEHQLTELLKTQQTLTRISRLNKSLLLLAKIDNGQLDDNEGRTVSFRTLLDACLPDYAEVYSHRGISLHLTDEGDFCLPMNESLASALLTNLLKNAYVHNTDEGKIIVHVHPRGIAFANTATRPKPLDATRIFQRFYHEPGREQSSGLGLSIAAAICRRQGLRLDYEFVEGMHRFSVELAKDVS